MPAFPGEYFKLIDLLLRSRTDAALRPLELTAAQSDLLFFLSARGEQETTLQDFGAHFGLKHPTVVGLIRRLEEKGFVSTAVSERDRRCRVVRLTGRFDEVQRVMRDARGRIDQQILRGFSTEETALLHTMLDRVYCNLTYQPKITGGNFIESK